MTFYLVHGNDWMSYKNLSFKEKYLLAEVSKVVSFGEGLAEKTQENIL